MWVVLPAKKTVLPRVKLLSSENYFPSKEAFAVAEINVHTKTAHCE